MTVPRVPGQRFAGHSAEKSADLARRADEDVPGGFRGGSTRPGPARAGGIDGELLTRDPRYLIVNADDFGLDRGVNRGIVRGHEEGIVTSATLMVRPPAAIEAAEYARAHPKLDVGLHVDLGEWAHRDGAWVSRYEVVSLDDVDAVGAEVKRQLGSFRRLVGRNPTHLDSHQHVHTREPVRSTLEKIARELGGVPVRHEDSGIRYCGSFYGQTTEGLPLPDAITPKHLIEILEGLAPGVTELACHPGDGVKPPVAYNHERTRELEALCDPAVRDAIARLGIELSTFGRHRRSREEAR